MASPCLSRDTIEGASKKERNMIFVKGIVGIATACIAALEIDVAAMVDEVKAQDGCL
jgi:hypothetical protein